MTRFCPDRPPPFCPFRSRAQLKGPRPWGFEFSHAYTSWEWCWVCYGLIHTSYAFGYGIWDPRTLQAETMRTDRSWGGRGKSARIALPRLAQDKGGPSKGGFLNNRSLSWINMCCLYTPLISLHKYRTIYEHNIPFRKAPLLGPPLPLPDSRKCCGRLRPPIRNLPWSHREFGIWMVWQG